MNILNWNIRGMNSPRKRQALSDYIRHYQVDMIAIQETKKDTFSDRILRNIAPRFDIWIYLPSHGASGGILFGGDSNKIEITQHSLHQFCIDIHLINKLDQNAWQFTIVYGPTIRSLKKALWIELDSLRIGMTKHWLLCGDFNVIRNHQEKSGPNFDIKISKMFNNFINRHNLVEHKLQTRRFTWASGVNFALLDRYFSNMGWDLQYPNSSVLDLSKNGSDHCPLLMQLNSSTHSHPPLFRFDPLWLEQEDFCNLIVKWWTEFKQKGLDIAKYW